ncbi:MAG: choice-of-anchor P family protein, partial [Candidatus Binatia bacterium]
MRHRAIYLALSLVVLGAVSAAHAQVTAQGRARSSAAFLLGIEVGLLTTGDTQLQTEVEPGDFSVTAQGATLEVPGVASVISAASSTMGTAAGIDSEVTSITGEVTADVLNGTVEVLGTSARAEVSCTEISANATVNALMVGNQAIDVPLNPQPNTVIEVLGVARVILNRQNMTINQATRSASIEVDAVVIEVLSGGGVLEVVLASAAASLSNLPASCPVIGGPGGMPNLVNSSKLAQLVTDGGTPGFADPGDRIRFTVRADNSGTAAATAVNILDRLPRFTTLDQASIRLNGATVASTINNCPANVNFNGCPGEVAVDAARQCLSANINDLASDQSADLTFEVTVNQGATANICNTAFIGDQERSAIVPIASGVPPGGTPN